MGQLETNNLRGIGGASNVGVGAYPSSPGTSPYSVDPNAFGPTIGGGSIGSRAFGPPNGITPSSIVVRNGQQVLNIPPKALDPSLLVQAINGGVVV